MPVHPFVSLRVPGARSARMLRATLLLVAALGALLLSIGLPLALGVVARASAAQTWQAPLRPLTVARPFQRPPTVYAAGHRGVDLEGQPGEVVRSAAAGNVSFAGSIAGRGVVVVVHGSLRTTYEPVLASLHRGAHVEEGQQIGVLETGHRGCPVAACLHWGLLRGDLYLDPMSVLTNRAVRLYPPAGFADAPVGGGAVQAPRAVEVAQLRPAALGSPSGPSPATWSLVALAGAGVVVTFRRR